MKKILFATDGSGPAQLAAEFLAHLPHNEAMDVTVVSVLFVPGSREAYFVEDWVETSLAEERARFDEAFAKVESVFAGANVQLQQIVREGHAGETIVAVAKEIQPELLVIGATGHSAISRILLGSTSDYVATHACCSVLVVRPTGIFEGQRPLHVAIAYEETGPAEAAVEEFAEFDWGKETEVQLVSATNYPGAHDVPEEARSYHAVNEAVKQLQATAPRVRGKTIHGDHIGETLVKFTEANDVDLMVVGEANRSRLSRVLMGSITRFVLRHASCSVWITRNQMVRGLSAEEAASDSHKHKTQSS